MKDDVERQPQLKAALESLQLRAWSCATTLRLARIVEGRESAYNTASGVLIEFPERAVIATAWHVLVEFRRLRSSGETVVLVCDDLPIFEPHTAYRDEPADIAFIEVPSWGRAGLHAVPYRPGSLWPPPQVRVEDVVLLCGFPRILRYDGDEILHGDLNLLLSVASAGDKYFMLQVDWENLVQAGRVKLPPGLMDYGGTSGGPVFLSDSGCNPLVGIVSQAGESLPLWRIASFAHVPPDIQTRPSEPV